MMPRNSRSKKCNPRDLQSEAFLLLQSLKVEAESAPHPRATSPGVDLEKLFISESRARRERLQHWVGVIEEHHRLKAGARASLICQ